MESLRAVAAEKEAGLTSQLEEHATKLEERDALHEQVALLQKELNLAHTTIAEQVHPLSHFRQMACLSKIVV